MQIEKQSKRSYKRVKYVDKPRYKLLEELDGVADQNFNNAVKNIVKSVLKELL